MIDQIISIILAIKIFGLPIFCSDRFDLYRQGTNDTPLTFAYSANAVTTDGFPLTMFKAPMGDLALADAAAENGVFWGIMYLQWDGLHSFHSYPDATVNGVDATAAFVAQIWDPNGNPTLRDFLTGPFSIWGVSSDGTLPEVFQAEWIEPSVQRQFYHVVAGAFIGFCFDLTFSPFAWLSLAMRRGISQL